MTVVSHNVMESLASRIKTPRLVIIEFILSDLPAIGSAGQMLYLSLVPNYVNKKDLHHEQIIFDLKNEEVITEHVEFVAETVRRLKGL